ncbi:MAG: Gfo/Idh/MocA family oxidoreductase [Candidatus Melainabacteria bacterium]|nr:Gfo/Idh/MocA family oxidoreductase [Candidatus Melainabacteria bacterium]
MLKAVIVGCGSIANKKHIGAFLKLKGLVELVAVCDLDEESARRTASKFKIKSYYTNLQEMISKEAPDIVDICTSPQTHAQLVVQSLEGGSNVIVEKPVALTVKDCDLMIETSLRCKRKLGVIHNQLFNPAIKAAQKLLNEGEIGTFLGMEIFLSTPRNCMVSVKDHWAHKLSGGIFNETSPHSVYLANAFLEHIYDVNISSKKIFSQYPWSSSEDFRIILNAENGICSITQIFGSNQWAADVSLFGTKGILKIDLQTKSVFKYDRKTLSVFPLGLSVLKDIFQSFKLILSNCLKYLFFRNLDAHEIAIKEFVECVINNKPFLVDIRDARETVRLIEMLVKKLEDKKQFEVSSRQRS